MTQRRKELRIEGNPIDGDWEEIVRIVWQKIQRVVPSPSQTLRAGSKCRCQRRADEASEDKAKHRAILAAVTLVVGPAVVGAWYLGTQMPREQPSSKKTAQRDVETPSQESNRPASVQLG